MSADKLKNVEYKTFHILGLDVKLRKRGLLGKLKRFYFKTTTMPMYEQVLNTNPAVNKLFPFDIKGTAKCCGGEFDFSVLFKNLKFIPLNDYSEPFDYAFVWGLGFPPAQKKFLKAVKKNHLPACCCEDGFLRSADTWANKKMEAKYTQSCSCILDDLTEFFDATRPSRIETMLNDKNLVITEEQKQRARILIDKITSNYLTKYNHQPIYTPEIGQKGRKKVLVVDQTFGDMSVVRGLASEDTFKNMLAAAISENPDADIIVKTHPDTLAGTSMCYFAGLKQQGNLYLMNTPINPIALAKYADKVYVCTTQMGMEALLCGKEVHTFGMPFYAGWGLTRDYLKCARRTNKRSIEELFYISYIMYSHYINPETKKPCEIEEAIDYLLKLRAEYFEKFKVRNEQ